MGELVRVFGPFKRARCVICSTVFSYKPHGGAERSYCSNGCRAEGKRRTSRKHYMARTLGRHDGRGVEAGAA